MVSEFTGRSPCYNDQMNDQKRMNAIMIYQYWFRAGVRCQLWFGAQNGRYVHWKARVPLVALETWWVLIAAAWWKIVLGNDWFFSHFVITIPVSLGVIVIIDRMLYTTTETRKEYEIMFHSWPKNQRRYWDIGFAMVLLGTFAFALYSVVTAGRMH